MTNMLWPNKSLIKGSKLYDVKKKLANRPKGIKDEDWKEFIAEEKLNKLIVLDKVPKTKRSSTPRNEE